MLLLCRCDVALAGHVPQDHIAASQGVGGVVDGRSRWVLRQAGQQRRLSQREVARRSVEVGLGGGLHPVGPVAVVDGIQIGRQDATFDQRSVNSQAKMASCTLSVRLPS